MVKANELPELVKRVLGVDTIPLLRLTFAAGTV
jgi:hypothetical protein